MDWDINNNLEITHVPTVKIFEDVKEDFKN